MGGDSCKLRSRSPPQNFFTDDDGDADEDDEGDGGGGEDVEDDGDGAEDDIHLFK